MKDHIKVLLTKSQTDSELINVLKEKISKSNNDKNIESKINEESKYNSNDNNDVSQKQINELTKIISDLQKENQILKDHLSKPKSKDEELQLLTIQKNLNVMMSEKQKLQELVDLLRNDVTKLENELEEINNKNINQIKNNNNNDIKKLQDNINTLRHHSQQIIRQRENQISILTKYIRDVVNKTSDQINSFRKVVLENKESSTDAIYQNLLNENDQLRKNLAEYQLKYSNSN